MSSLRLMILLCSALLLLAACSQDNSGTTDNASATKSTGPAMPSDPDLATLYQQTCYSCHSRNTTGAPVAGNTLQWKSRVAKGMDKLVANTINGVGGMPPLGLCMSCDEQDFRDLIQFMSGQE